MFMYVRRSVRFVFFVCVTAGVFFSPVFAGEKPVSGYGWSVAGGSVTVKTAVSEAVSMLEKSVKKPDFVFLFSTVGYDSQALLDEVRKQLGKNVKIYGGTSCLGVASPDGFHVGETASLTILGVKSDRIQFGVGGADLDKEKTPRDAGRKAIVSAIKNAGKKEREKPGMILITCAPGKEEEILKGIAEIVGDEVPVIGGSSGDNDITGKWRQFANGKAYSNGVALTAFYSDGKIGWSFKSGYLRSSAQGVITESEYRTIYKIDGKPAAEVYNTWLDGAFNDIMETGGNILARSAFHPLAKVIRGEGGETHYLSMHPSSINLPDKSLTLFADVNKGDRVSLMNGNWEILLYRAYSTTLDALTYGNIAQEESLFAVYTFCAGTMLAIPRDELPKIPLLIGDTMAQTPFIVTFTFGEQGFCQGVGNLHGNLVTSMVIFGK